MQTVSGDASIGHDGKRRGQKRPFSVDVPSVVHPTGRVFDHMQGGPYKYGRPLIVTRDTLRALEAGVL
jgi:hypothetical protein